MAYVNGRIPSSALKRLPGNNAGILKPYAYSYWALHYHTVKVARVSLAIYDASVGRTYRTYARQLLAKRIYGSNAATPGTSNHGWGRAVDLQTSGQINATNRYGAPYGWQKRWSDAGWEPWHMRGVKAMASPAAPDPFKPLGPRQKLACRRLLFHRREMAREKRSGEGPRFRKQLKHARAWRKLVKHYLTGGNAQQRAVMRRVLKATDGRM